jgi:hypothetical protein
MLTTDWPSRIARRRIKPFNPRRQALFSARLQVQPRRRCEHVSLSPPEYLTLETDGIWPPASEPASIATQYHVKILRERQHALRVAAIAAMCFFVVMISAFLIM